MSDVEAPIDKKLAEAKRWRENPPEFISDFQFWFNVVLFLITVIVGAWYIYMGYAFFKGNKYAGTVPPSDVARALLIFGWVIIIGMSYAATYLGTRAARMDEDPEQYRRILTYSYLAFAGTAVWAVGFTFNRPVVILLGNAFNIVVTSFRLHGLMRIQPIAALLLVPFLILNAASLCLTVLNLPCGKNVESFCY